MGNNYYADLSPAVTMENILELRIFGQGGELLFWRSDAGLTGRALVDVGLPEEYFLSPFEEKQILLGTPQESINNSFTRVANSAGREQALPLVIAGDRPLKLEQPPFRLVIKHYFTQDDNGAVRVFVSRLVDLEVSIDGYA